MKKSILFGISSLFLSYAIFALLQNLFKGSSTEAFILFGTLILSTTIAVCSGAIIDCLEKQNKSSPVHTITSSINNGKN